MLNISYKWSCTICGLFLSFTIMISKYSHVVVYINISFLSMAEKYTTICIYHILFILSSGDEYLGCFYLLVIMIMLLWTSVHKCFVDIYFSWMRNLGVKLLGHMVTPCITFWGSAKLKKWLHHFTTPPAIYEHSNFPTSLSTLVIIHPFTYSHAS